MNRLQKIQSENPRLCTNLIAALVVADSIDRLTDFLMAQELDRRLAEIDERIAAMNAVPPQPPAIVRFAELIRETLIKGIDK